MKIIHSINGHQVERDVDDRENIGTLLTNGLGGYGAFAKINDSRYDGWFVALDQKLFKVIDEIRLLGGLKINKIKNDFYKTERFFEGGLSESMFFPRERNSLVYTLSKEGSMEIILDVREPYDGRNFGRVYEIMEEDGLTIIKYSKYRNWEEDKSDGKEFEIYLAINAGGGKIEKAEQWFAKHYDYDQKRASMPFDKHVFKALKITAKKVVISAALDKETAKSESLSIFKTAAELENKEKKRLDKSLKCAKFGDEKTIVSCAAAKNSLASLLVQDGNKFGVYAGLPWFFQFWTSDESICLKSVSGIDKNLAKKILLRDISYINDDGKMYDVLNGKASGQYTLNMDASGWLFKRAAQMIKDGILDKNEIKGKIIQVIESIRKNHLRDGFVYSEAGETWMDTFYAGDLRDGARIEIQALMLSMYKIAFEITLDEKYKVWELELRESVRRKFWNGKILADGLSDFTIRPNIFIAHYIYPDLLSKVEWKACFKEALAHLWLAWGGLATIDKTSTLFYNEYTGETPESYHRGDSWFWINNMAALALCRVDEHIFRDYIGKILEASSDEILWHGVIGHMSELSSAKDQRSEGAWAQAWSAAMYMEAIEEIVKSHESVKVTVESAVKNNSDPYSGPSVEEIERRNKIIKSFMFNASKANKDHRSAKAVHETSHKHLLKVYEILLAIMLIFSASMALGAAAFAAIR